MNKDGNVRFLGKLRRFIRTGEGRGGISPSADESLRELVRLDHQQREQASATWLRQELEPGFEAADSEFVEWDADALISEAKARGARRLER